MRELLLRDEGLISLSPDFSGVVDRGRRIW
jgi:hypothetical protein